MSRCVGGVAVAVLTWVLLTPPDGGVPSDAFGCTGCADPGHLDDAAPLTLWRKLGSFEDVVACRARRRALIVEAQSDQEWSDYQLSRCVPRERVYQGRLTPDERASD